MHNTMSTQQESQIAQIKLQRLHKNNFQNLNQMKMSYTKKIFNRRKKYVKNWEIDLLEKLHENNTEALKMIKTAT